MDTLSRQARSERMSLIRSRDTAPELVVRHIVHALGFRYRLHVKTLPGKPDLVFSRLRKVIFVHGCFWHRHKKRACKLARMPKSHLEFWKPKLEGNRDARRNPPGPADGAPQLFSVQGRLPPSALRVPAARHGRRSDCSPGNRGVRRGPEDVPRDTGRDGARRVCFKRVDCPASGPSCRGVVPPPRASR